MNAERAIGLLILVLVVFVILFFLLKVAGALA